jgi:hypothetical protein
MKLLSFFCSFLFSLPFLALVIANILSYFAVDFIPLWEKLHSSFLSSESSQRRDSFSQQLTLWSKNLPAQLSSVFGGDLCSVYSSSDDFQGIHLFLLFNLPFLDIQRDIYNLTNRSFQDYLQLLIFPVGGNPPDERLPERTIGSTRSYLLDYYQDHTSFESERTGPDNRLQRWTTIKVENNSIIQVGQLYDERNVVSEGTSDQPQPKSETSFADRKDSSAKDIATKEDEFLFSNHPSSSSVRKKTSGKHDCQSVYRSAFVFQSNYSINAIFSFLASWKALNLYFLTKSWNVTVDFPASF